MSGVPRRVNLNVLNKPVSIRIPDADVNRLCKELGVPSKEPSLNGKILGDPTSCDNYIRATDFIIGKRKSWLEKEHSA